MRTAVISRVSEPKRKPARALAISAWSWPSISCTYQPKASKRWPTFSLMVRLNGPSMLMSLAS